MAPASTQAPSQDQRALDLLPAPYSQALALAEQGMGPDDVAAHLGIEPRAGVLLVSVARQKLEAIVDDADGASSEAETAGGTDGRAR